MAQGILEGGIVTDFSLLICSLLFSVLPTAHDVDAGLALETCGELAYLVAETDLPVSLVIALGYHESKYNPAAVSSAGAIGPLQILPFWGCPEVVACWQGGGGRCLRRFVAQCDATAAGLDALRTFLIKAKWDEHRAICSYTGCRVSGNTGFVAEILTTAAWLERSLACRCSIQR